MKLTNILLAICIIAASTVSAQNHNVTFHLHTRRNPTSSQRLTMNEDSITSSNYNPENRVVMFIHDWNSNSEDRLNTGGTSAFLRKGDYNIISVNWGAASSSYDTALDAVDTVAERIANEIDFINSNFSMGFLQIVGHGMGAHIAGSVGHQLGSGRLGKIVGLDPIKPIINYNNINKRLSPDDAIYVESIQTNGGQWGWDRPLGKATFYPNDGRTQPSCSGENVNWCSHWRAVDYYVEALLYNNYKSKECATSQDAHLGSCESNFSNVRLAGPNNYSRGVSGNFTVPVHASSPYGTADLSS